MDFKKSSAMTTEYLQYINFNLTDNILQTTIKVERTGNFRCVSSIGNLCCEILSSLPFVSVFMSGTLRQNHGACRRLSTDGTITVSGDVGMPLPKNMLG
jgi:hypothetical protein